MPVTMAEVLNYYGVEGKESGGRKFYHCPFHPDRDPSFVVGGDFSPDSGFCFGGCDKKDVIDVVSHFEVCGFREAVELIRQRWDPDFRPDINLSDPAASQPSVRTGTPAWRKLLSFLRKELESHWDDVAQAWEEAKRYPLPKKGTSYFRCGFLSEEGYEELETLTPEYDGKFLKRLINRVLFPVFSLDGSVMGFWGRAVGKTCGSYASRKNLYVPLRPKDKKGKGPTPVPLGLFQAQGRTKTPWLVCEGSGDALMAAEVLKTVSPIAVGGTVSNFSKKKLEKWGVSLSGKERIFLAPDPDYAGQISLIRKMIEKIQEWGEVWVVNLPEGVDLDEYLVEHGELPETLTAEEWIRIQKEVHSPEPAEVQKSMEAEEVEERIRSSRLEEATFEEILHIANSFQDPDQQDEFLKSVASARKMTLKSLRHHLEKAMKDAFLSADKATTFIHPAIDTVPDANLAIIGFKGAELFLGKKREFPIYVTALKGLTSETRVSVLQDEIWELSSKRAGKESSRRFCVLPFADLPEMDQVIGRDGITRLRETLDSSEDLAKAVFDEVLDVYQRYIYLETQAYYYLVTAYTIMTYFHRLFPSIPFLFLYGNKGCGKSRCIQLLQRLCFNAQVVTRSSEAVIGDILDARGTLIIDQAEFLAIPQYEPMVNFLAGSYTQDTANRAIVQMEGRRRTIKKFDCFGPKIFAGTKDVHYDLRDRLLTVPFTKADRSFPAPTPTSEAWNELRVRLYALFFQRFDSLYDELQEHLRDPERMLSTHETLTAEDVKGRPGEITLPIFLITQMCRPEAANEVLSAMIQDIKAFTPMVYDFDEMIIGSLAEVIRESYSQNDIVFVPVSDVVKHIAEVRNAEVRPRTVFEVIRRNGACYHQPSKGGEMGVWTSLELVTRRLASLRGTPSSSPRPQAGTETPVSDTVFSEHGTEFLQ